MRNLALLIALIATASDSTSITGRWTSGRLSTIQYRDAYTGVARAPAGNHFAYEFHPNGTYTFTGLMQTTLYNCTTSLFSEESGRYTLSGSNLSLQPAKNPYRMRNSCAPSSNREAPGKLTPRTFTVHRNNSTLELLAESESAPAVFRLNTGNMQATLSNQ